MGIYMFYNPYLNYDEYEKIVNPYFLSTLTPANHVYPYLSSSAKNVYLSPPTITIEKDRDKKDKDKKSIKINFPSFAPLYQSYIPHNYTYQNVNNDRDLIRNVTKYFFEGTMNRWLYSDFQELLKYLVIKKGKVHVVSNREELSKNKLDNNMNDMKLKVKFISEYVMTKHDVRSFIKKLSLKSGVDLWKFKDYKSRVKKSIF